MPQREDDISASIDAMTKALDIKDGEFSGGQIHAFRKGWAVCIWTVGGRAHYWRRSPFNLAYVESRCGDTAATASMYGEGNIPRCKRCMRFVAKDIATALRKDTHCWE